MPDFDNLEKLFRHIEKDMMEIMDKNIADVGKTTESRHVQLDVYDKYTEQEPYIERRGMFGGLADMHNMIHTVTHTKDGIELFIKNITKGNSSVYKTDPVQPPNYLAGIIEKGRSRGRYLTNKTDSQQQYLQPREFIHNSILELERTLEHVQEMKRVLKSKGYDVI